MMESVETTNMLLIGILFVLVLCIVVGRMRP